MCSKFLVSNLQCEKKHIIIYFNNLRVIYHTVRYMHMLTQVFMLKSLHRSIIERLDYQVTISMHDGLQGPGINPVNIILYQLQGTSRTGP